MWLNRQLTCRIRIVGLQVFTTGNVGYKEARGRMMGLPPLPCPLRFKDVMGFEGRTNDIIYCPPKNPDAPTATVVYFGGDVQDYPELMEKHRDNKNYLKWNLECTALVLQTSFPESHIVIVKPSRSLSPKLARFMDIVSDDLDYTRMEFKTFACYDNFVPSNSCGAPDHTPNHYALLHLERLLQSLTIQIKQTVKSESTEEAKEIYFPSLDKVNIQVIGFSKGCVVLNQFIYEFHYCKTLTPEDDSMTRLVSHVTDMYWLDGGHAGGKNTWVTSRSLLETLTRLGIKIHVHVTPYQVKDDRRPWIGKEEKLFSELLRKQGAAIERTVHFESLAPCLETHFDLLTEFKKADTLE